MQTFTLINKLEVYPEVKISESCRDSVPQTKFLLFSKFLLGRFGFIGGVGQPKDYSFQNHTLISI